MEIKYKNRLPYNSGKAVVLSVPRTIIQSFEDEHKKAFKDLVFTLKLDDGKLIYEVQPDADGYEPPTSKRYDAAFKKKVVEAAKNTDNVSEVARSFGISTTSVSNWLKEPNVSNKT